MKIRLLSGNGVALAGSLFGLASLSVDWLSVKPNRLASGVGLNIFNAFGWMFTALISALWLTCLIASFTKSRKTGALFYGTAANLTLVLSIIYAGQAAFRLTAGATPLTRVALSSGWLVSAFGALMLILAARRALPENRITANILSFGWLAPVVALLWTGRLNQLSIVQEYFANSARFGQELVTHLTIFAASAAVGTLLGIPLGIWAARSRKANRPIFWLANTTQTIPSLALFGLLIAPLSALSNACPFLQNVGIHGIGAAPAIIALTIYALLPVVQNTFSGLQQLDPAILDAAKGMGMNGLQLLRRVELPLAAPLILTGIRTAAVQAVGNTAVAALIGAGGLGQFIFQGLGQAATDLILLGAIPIIVLALIVDNIMLFLATLASPKGARMNA